MGERRKRCAPTARFRHRHGLTETTMEALPINLCVKNQPIAIAGGGTMAARRAELALKAGARVMLFAPDITAEFPEDDRLVHLPRDAEVDDLRGCRLAFGAADDDATNEAFHRAAKAAGVLVNVADRPDLCDFIMPAILDRSPLVISISSAGASPILARVLKARLETYFPASFGRLAKFAGALRGEVMRRLSRLADRRRFFETLIDGPIADLVLAGREDEARKRFEKELAAAAEKADAPPMGEVYLVGAGPGDPDLMTFRAMRLIQRADVVLYDRLIGQGLLNLVRRDAERIYVGKLPKEHTLQQEEISALLVRLAKQGKRVLRLKGGDPFIFGRGGEEIERLAEEGIPFQVVPGVTAAASCAAYAGIPLTHRDHAQACVFVTGHGKDGKVDLNWEALVQPRQTVAVYMGLLQLPVLVANFIAHGASPDLPAAVVENGTRRSQKVVVGTLATLEDKVRDAKLKGPAIIIIGTVVTLREKLAWFVPDEAPESLSAVSRDAIPAPPPRPQA